MRRLNAAWEVLGDPTRRAEYDQYLRRPNGRAGSSAAEQATEGRPAARGPSWTGAAGPPPGLPSGSVLGFGRFSGWSIGEIVRADPG